MPLIFQYGSNTDAVRFKERLGDVDDRGLAQTIGEYEIAFNVWSQGNGCAASNLMPTAGSGRRAWGVLYDVPCELVYGRDRGGRRTLEQIEGPLYERKPIKVRDLAGSEITEPVTTFLVKEDAQRSGLWTTADYVGHIVKGLRDHGVGELERGYLQYVIERAARTNEQADDREAGRKQNELLRKLLQ